ncbi:hypothetical protein EDB86DRAFT_1194745 [Lactarius hatsudake]|nr:hypothetical protein EDB86DRAFT_1194745 [Lactarius hatsudake]
MNALACVPTCKRASRTSTSPIWSMLSPCSFIYLCSSSLAVSSSSFITSTPHLPGLHSHSLYPVSFYIPFLPPCPSSTMTVPSRPPSLPFYHISLILSPTTVQESAAAATNTRNTLHWHPEKHSTHLTQLWAHDGSEEGAELDHTALRWTLLALTDLRDLEQFIAALPALLQSDSSSTLTRDGGRAAQALLFGQDMLAVHLVRLLHSTFPSDALALPPAERQRLEARAATCLRTVMLLARACDGPTLAAPQHWPAWAITYFNPVARDALALRQHPDLGTLAQSTALLLAWRALVAYRSFLDDIAQRAANAAAAPPMARARAAVELRTRKSAGEYLLRVLREVLHGLAGGTAGSTLADAGQELLGGNLYAHLYGPAAHGPRGGSGNGAAAGTTGGAGAGPDVETNGLAQAARADLPKAKVCLAVLFMLGACSLPADPTGEETVARARCAPGVAGAVPLRRPRRGRCGCSSPCEMRTGIG